MLGGLLVMGLVGSVVGIGLALASKIFYVYVDPKIEAVDEALPGANCGGCGLPGCSSNAAAIVNGQASASSCVAGGPEIAEEIAAILGVALEAREPDIALPGCRYGLEDADLKYIYDGVQDCRAAMLLAGGTKVCYAGCLGLGTCVSACPFGALSMGQDSLPVVDQELCTGCGTCERVCPKHIITLSSNSRKVQQEYTTFDCTTPCQRACPAGIDIPAYIHEISEGRYLEAVRVIKQRNPFSSVCGRICVHPCEDDCRRALVDAPIAINDLKRYATDHERKSGTPVQVPRAPETGKQMAVVGGGAEGLTAAYFLNRLGHEVTVYESTSTLGGLLRTGLPENRLPREIIDWDIQGILDVGVQVKTDQRLGQDVSISFLLKEGASAVFVATGGWDTQLSERAKGGASSPIPGVRILVDFVLAVRQDKNPSIGKNVMIIGGGNAALEAGRACLAGGAESVQILFRHPEEEVTVSKKDLREAESEGIKILYQTVLIRMMGQGDNLTHVEVMNISHMGEADVMNVDMILTGAGRFPELIYVARVESPAEPNGDIEGTAKPLETSDNVETWQTVIPYAGIFAKDYEGLFRDGEVISDYKAVIEAIGAGRRAATAVQQYVSGEQVEAPVNMIRRHTSVVTLSSLEPLPKARREDMPELSPEEQLQDPLKEIILGFSQEQARKESHRCLQCGIICYRRTKGTVH